MEIYYDAIKLDNNDNVAVTLRNIESGEIICIQGSDEKIEVKKDISYGHKIALSDIDEGKQIIKYGECIGITTERILQGFHVHVFNVRGLNSEERANIISGFGL